MDSCCFSRSWEPKQADDITHHTAQKRMLLSCSYSIHNHYRSLCSRMSILGVLEKIKITLFSVGNHGDHSTTTFESFSSSCATMNQSSLAGYQTLTTSLQRNGGNKRVFQKLCQLLATRSHKLGSWRPTSIFWKTTVHLWNSLEVPTLSKLRDEPTPSIFRGSRLDVVVM